MNFEIASKSTEIRANWDEASLYCFSLGEGWRLPNEVELNRIYESENDFEKDGYWSSTVHNTDSAWAKYFIAGGLYCGSKFSILCVRAIRSLT